MVRFRDYLLIQYKRIFKLLFGIVAMILVVAMLLSAAGFALMYSDTYASENQKYKLGVVGDTDDEMISLGVYMIGTLDESRYMIELVEYEDEEAARAAMRNAEISAYIVITEEFSDALNAMTNDAKLQYYATSGQKGISNVMMDEIALIATHIIIYSETGICTLRQLMKEEGYDKAYRHEKINDLFMVYISALITRTSVAEITELGLSDGLSTPAYYFLGILLFFMLLLSFCAISYFIGTKDAQYKFMKSKGINSRAQVVGEFIPFLTINIICVLIIMGLITAVCSSGMIDEEMLASAGIDDFGMITLNLIPVCVMFSAFGFMIFELLIGVINKILVAFMLYIGMAYVSGYFYPKPFFPEIVQRLGEWIPSGIAFSYMGAGLQYEPQETYLLIMAGYAVVFLGVAIFARRQKIR
ncbi:ABC transporter permease [Pseudobutyrivibrio sp. MD2005]|uniref:ABC transporter permease n=1 Tax=Pseudobutyrivibrio sp. MD2005 TaxID=1410616 RepID=UPI0009DD16FB|nr:ABC transporter permease [Pseudobutyrivibrio sp. MD2005]